MWIIDKIVIASRNKEWSDLLKEKWSYVVYLNFNSKTKLNFLTCALETLKVLKIDCLAFFPTKERMPLREALSGSMSKLFPYTFFLLNYGMDISGLLRLVFTLGRISLWKHLHSKKRNLLLKMSWWTFLLLWAPN